MNAAADGDDSAASASALTPLSAGAGTTVPAPGGGAACAAAAATDAGAEVDFRCRGGGGIDAFALAAAVALFPFPALDFDPAARFDAFAGSDLVLRKRERDGQRRAKEGGDAQGDDGREIPRARGNQIDRRSVQTREVALLRGRRRVEPSGLGDLPLRPSAGGIPRGRGRLLRSSHAGVRAPPHLFVSDFKRTARS